MEKFIDKVRKLIEDGDLESALDRILVCLAGKNTRLHNEATLHKSSLSQNNRSLRQGIITNDEASRVRARINLAVLSLLIEIEKEGIKCGDERGAKINPGTNTAPAARHHRRPLRVANHTSGSQPGQWQRSHQRGVCPAAF